MGERVITHLQNSWEPIGELFCIKTQCIVTKHNKVSAHYTLLWKSVSISVTNLGKNPYMSGTFIVPKAINDYKDKNR